MATKFYNDQARVFKALLKGADFETLKNEKFKEIEATEYCCSVEQANEYREQNKIDVLEVKTFFDKIKFLEKPEIYAVNSWGYGQSNYENLKVLGQIGGSMVCIIDDTYSNVYTVSKSKYSNKANYTSLDSDRVRSTNWAIPYTNKKMQENSEYNAYSGH